MLASIKCVYFIHEGWNETKKPEKRNKNKYLRFINRHAEAEHTMNIKEQK